MKYLTLKLYQLRYFFYCLLVVGFIWWFKVAVDKWNADVIEYNKQRKKDCPCEKWHYVTKGHWDCDCPQNKQ